MTKSQVEKFQQIYKQTYGIELSYEESLYSAVKLVEVVRQVYRPIKKEEWDKFFPSENSPP